MALTWLCIAPTSPLVFASPIDGSACAATIMDLLYGIVLTLYCAVDADCQKCWSGLSRKAWGGWWVYLQLAMPACAMGVFEWWSWDIVNYLAGLTRDPSQTLATNALLGQIISLAYCLSLGVQQGAQTLVGNAVGAGDVLCAKRATRVGFCLGAAAMLVQCAFLIVFRHSWASLFQDEKEVHADPNYLHAVTIPSLPPSLLPQVGERVASLMPLVACFTFLDGIQVVLSGIIIGAGKQGATPVILLVCYWVVGLPLGAVAAFDWPHNGLVGLWWGMTVAVSLHLVSYLAICFPCPRQDTRGCRLPFAIDWEEAVRMAEKRHEEKGEEEEEEGSAPAGERHERVQRLAAAGEPWAPP